MPIPDLVDLASRYWQSAALTAAVQLGVFEELAKDPTTAESLAGRLNTSHPHTEALLDALCGLGVLTKQKEAYTLPDGLRPLLDPASPDCLLPALHFNADLFGLWTRLGDCVRQGAPVLPGNPHLGMDPERMRRFVEGMHSRAGVMARGLLPHVELPPGASILDVGGGPGTFSLKLAERDPSLRSTVLDLPPVAAAAAALHAGHPALDRVTFEGGDYHTAPFPPGRDAVLYCGALHQEPEEGVAALLTRMRAALVPGGSLWVIDLMLDDDRTTPVYSALFELNMMLMRPASRVYTRRRVEHLLREAGLVQVESTMVEGTPYALVRGLNP